MTLDEKYIEKLSPSLPNFRKVKDGVYRFDCVFCENSKTNNKKWSRRTNVSLGYLYLKGYTYNYCCHITKRNNEGIEPKPVQKISIRNISGCFPTQYKILP